MTSIVRNRVGIGIVVVLALLLLAGGGLAVAQEGGQQHENPDEIDEEGDPAELERWFGNQMGEMHVDCSEGMAVGDFDACEDLDEEYESYLERYVTVERETTSNESERDADEFNETRTQQQELAEQLQEFEQTRQEYEAARERGDDATARARAREMRRQADRIQELGDNVSSGFRELDDETAADLGAAANQTDETTAGVTSTADEAESEALDPVEFGVQSDAEASFTDPATVSGIVRTESWEPVTSGRVVVRDDAGVRANATVDGNGTWRTTYRPVATETGETTLRARFVPDNESAYMAANGTTPVIVEATATTVDLENTSEGASYGENVTATGTLSAAGERAAGVPVRLTVRDRVVGTARTDAEGRFEVTGPLPATVPVGEVMIYATGGEGGTALEPSMVSRSIAVNETATTISAEVNYDGDQAHISGRLETVDGEPVGGQPVTLSLNGGNRTVSTDGEGVYSLTIDRPSEDREATLMYNEPNGNLRTSMASVTVEAQTEDRFPGFGDFSEAVGVPGIGAGFESLLVQHPFLALFVAVAIVTSLVVWLAVGLRWLRRRRSGTPIVADDDEGDLEPAVRRVTDDDATGLEAARQQIEGAPSMAVQLAFTTVRTALGMDDARTHWEVYRAASDDLDGETREALRAVTEAFEAATFSPEGVDRERARAALEDAERCLSAPDGGEPGDSTVEVATDGSAPRTHDER